MSLKLDNLFDILRDFEQRLRVMETTNTFGVADVFSQDGEPTTSDIGSGEMAFWIDTNDGSRLYLCYNQSGTIKTVELT